MNKLDLESKDIIKSNIEKIAELFPNVITEGENGLGIDLALLKQELSSELIDETKERYQLTWPGKQNAIHQANTSITKTLRPLKEKSVGFDSTENIYIEGDNLEALKILQESYLGKIKCIYIDPPYNTGKDFIYKDNFHKSIKETLTESNQIDSDGNKFQQNLYSEGKYHSNWLSMMYPRLKLARNLLTDDGVIFISIDDNEESNLKKICDEIFGEENCVSNLIWKKKSGGTQGDFIIGDTEYIKVYAKSKDKLVMYNDKHASSSTSYNKSDENGNYSLEMLEKKSLGYVKSLDFPILAPDGTEYKINHENEKHKVARWRWNEDTVKERYDELVFQDGKVYTKNYEKNSYKPRNLLVDERFGRTRTGKTDLTSLFNIKELFSAPKPVKLIKYLTSISTGNNDIVLDFFSGSATTAQAIMELNTEDKKERKYICIQIPDVIEMNSTASIAGYENICEIAQERIKRASKKIKNETNAEIDYGFRVYTVDESNMKDVFYKPTELSQSMLEFVESNIKSDRTNLDLLTQVILDLGLTLDLKITEMNINNNIIFDVDNGNLLACFDDKLTLETIERMAKNTNEHDIAPEKIVVKESAFNSDKDLLNAVEKVKNISEDVKFVVL